MPNWSNVYDEFIAGLLLIIFTALVGFVLRAVFGLSFKRYVASIAVMVIRQCPRVPFWQLRRWIKNERSKHLDREG
jgi:hypothetical protein